MEAAVIGEVHGVIQPERPPLENAPPPPSQETSLEHLREEIARMRQLEERLRAD